MIPRIVVYKSGKIHFNLNGEPHIHEVCNKAGLVHLRKFTSSVRSKSGDSLPFITSLWPANFDKEYEFKRWRNRVVVNNLSRYPEDRLDSRVNPENIPAEIHVNDIVYISPSIYYNSSKIFVSLYETVNTTPHENLRKEVDQLTQQLNSIRERLDDKT